MMKDYGGASDECYDSDEVGTGIGAYHLRNNNEKKAPGVEDLIKSLKLQPHELKIVGCKIIKIEEVLEKVEIELADVTNIDISNNMINCINWLNNL